MGESIAGKSRLNSGLWPTFTRTYSEHLGLSSVLMSRRIFLIMAGPGSSAGKLARLRDRIARIETDHGGGMPGRAALGHGEADAVLQGGLARGAVHEVFAEGRHSAAATGFIAGLAQRVGKDRPLLWVRQDFAARESGALSMRGWRELGLDPCLLVTVHAPDVESALRTAADALACDALGAVVMEIWGETRLLDLVASRRLTLAARASGVTGLLLRVAASRCLRPRRHGGSCARRARRQARHGRRGAPPCSKPGLSVIVMARPANGSWSGSVMSASSVTSRSMVRRRILSLWLPRLPTDRIRRELLRFGGLDEACDSQSSSAKTKGKLPHIVVAKQNNALVITALDDVAARLGLAVGLPLANARAICPDIDVFDADEIADEQTLNGIADWCDRFTPLVALDPPHGLLLDITGCAHLFGGEAALMNALCDALTRHGFVVSAAIAGTPVCARALTRHAHGRIVAPGEELEAVAPLPVFTLGADDAITRGLRRAGLKTIGDVAARGRHEIAARFGAAFTARPGAGAGARRCADLTHASRRRIISSRSGLPSRSPPTAQSR